MEELQSNNPVEIVIKTISSDGIFMKNIKEHTNKTTGAKAAEYFLNLKSQNEIVENIDDQFVAVAEDCEDNENQQYVTVEVQDSDGIILNEKEVIIWDELCRICANSNEQFIPIFSGEGLEHDLYNKINSYLPVKVSENDSLPHQICYNCAATLLSWHDMFKGCIEAHQRLTELQNKFNSKDEFSNDSTEEIIDTVFEVETVANEESEAQSCREVKQERLPDTPSELERCENVENQRITTSSDPLASEPDVLSTTSKAKKPNSNKKQSTKQQQQRNEDNDAAANRRAELARAKIVVDKATAYQCPDCPSILSTGYNYQVHRRVHTQEHGCSCSLCGKSFTTNSSLARHKREVHDKIKEFQCEFCERKLASRVSRDEHRRTHTDERPHVCDVCGKRFRQRASLSVHKRFHGKTYAFSCKLCNRAFMRKQDFQRHELTHTDLLPYGCTVCSKRFRSSGSAIRHKQTHYSIAKFICDACGQYFNTERSLNAHKKKVH